MLRRALWTTTGPLCLGEASALAPSPSSSPSSSTATLTATAAAQPTAAHRGLKARKRPKVSPTFPKQAQGWRERYMGKQQQVLADSLRSYVNYSTTRRIAPYDTRFAPFDRHEKDGVYIIMKHMMDEKLHASNNHAPAVKRLFANVGLLGPQVTTQARWRPWRFSTLSHKAQYLEESWTKDPTVKNGPYTD
jgi:hypothetical protein